jgi:hypothetical protein
VAGDQAAEERHQRRPVAHHAPVPSGGQPGVGREFLPAGFAEEFLTAAERFQERRRVGHGRADRPGRGDADHGQPGPDGDADTAGSVAAGADGEAGAELPAGAVGEAGTVLVGGGGPVGGGLYDEAGGELGGVLGGTGGAVAVTSGGLDRGAGAALTPGLAAGAARAGTGTGTRTTTRRVTRVTGRGAGGRDAERGCRSAPVLTRLTGICSPAGVTGRPGWAARQDTTTASSTTAATAGPNSAADHHGCRLN